MPIEIPPSKSISEFVKRLNGRSSRKFQKEYPELQRKYWGKYFWVIGYGAWSTGNVTDKMIQEHLKHHKDKSNFESGLVVDCKLSRLSPDESGCSSGSAPLPSQQIVPKGP